MRYASAPAAEMLALATPREAIAATLRHGRHFIFETSARQAAHISPAWAQLHAARAPMPQYYIDAARRLISGRR